MCRDNGIGVGVREQGSAVVASSRILDSTCSAFYSGVAGARGEYEGGGGGRGAGAGGGGGVDDEDKGTGDDWGGGGERGCLVVVGSHSNTRTWYNGNRPTSLNDYIFQVGSP